MAKPSPKMLKMVKYIQKDLNIRFEGSKDEFDDVSKFISEHIEDWKSYKLKKSPLLGEQVFPNTRFSWIFPGEPFYFPPHSFSFSSLPSVHFLNPSISINFFSQYAI